LPFSVNFVSLVASHRCGCGKENDPKESKKKAAAAKKAKKRSSCEIVSPGVLGENDCSNRMIGEVAYFLYPKREEAGAVRNS
jgi:hypothetical protein